MFTNRFMIAFLSIAVFSAPHGVASNVGSGAGQQQAAKSSNGPVLGKWEFTGKDNTGLAWTGTLAIEKLDPNRFDPNKYHSYTAVLSGDIRSLTRGKRTESKKDAKQSGQSGTSAVSRACPAGRILAEPMAVCRSRAGQMGPSKPRLASARRRWLPGITGQPPGIESKAGGWAAYPRHFPSHLNFAVFQWLTVSSTGAPPARRAGH